MSFHWHPDALEEYEDATLFYGTREDGLDARFHLLIEEAIEDICSLPEAWPLFLDETRRRIVNVFPYSVIYVSENDSVLIVAIMHDSRKPGYWLRRLS
jgi:plasmid stabilization system protein ParE